jgi:hypothetical protein
MKNFNNPTKNIYFDRTATGSAAPPFGNIRIR